MSSAVVGDTIAAIATPAGVGALSIVRISGPDVLAVADECFRGGKRPSEMPSHTVAYGRIVEGNGRVLDRVVLTVMRGPRTSTGEDTVEISCHGGRLPAARVLDRVLRAGARLAEPGEFTRRAFLNGRVDLVQAEGVLEVIRARTQEGLDAAMRQLSGEVSLEFQRVREQLDECRTQLECAIDFAEEAAPWSDQEIETRLIAVSRDLETILGRARAGRKLQDGALVAIVGRPNVGKSTLFNVLVGEDRVIVSDQPGTTRDVVAEWTSFGGIPVRLVDTAGIRPSPCAVERAAVDRAREQGTRAELAVLLLDASQVPNGEDRAALAGLESRRLIVVLNKTDLGVSGEVESFVQDRAPGVAVVRVSALFGRGIEGLRDLVARRITDNVDPEGGMTASVRQIDILTRTSAALEKGLQALRGDRGIELAATDLAEAIEIFGDMAGRTTTEEMLDRIFSRFCIGK